MIMCQMFVFKHRSLRAQRSNLQLISVFYQMHNRLIYKKNISKLHFPIGLQILSKIFLLRIYQIRK